MGAVRSHRGNQITCKILSDRHFQQGGRLRVPRLEFLPDRRDWQLGREPQAAGGRDLRVQLAALKDVRAPTREQALAGELGGLPTDFLGFRHHQPVPNQASRSICVLLRSRLQHPPGGAQI